ncbi:BQ2448_6120 [Microbotryum intermedium]|uniref:BQ2448_6120 protein n=1 Tax=Microbotryum intermedium TaxID=269621 RepID=A0A238FIS4_9BASI|nr:BQ2448_6120 [Microbotryum intermedium]
MKHFERAWGDPFHSYYRLADFLQLEQLRRLALRSIVSQLNAGNVAWELFGQLGANYNEIREKAFDFTIRKWPEVKKTEGMQNVQRWVQEGRFASAIELLL